MINLIRMIINGNNLFLCMATQGFYFLLNLFELTRALTNSALLSSTKWNSSLPSLWSEELGDVSTYTLCP